MPDPADDRLRDLLAGEPPPSVLALPERDRDALVEVLIASRRRQADDLRAAFAASLKHVPFPVRGIVKKVLLG